MRIMMRNEIAQELSIVEMNPTLQVGIGRSMGQHGELFQGQISDRGNRQCRCLISLPCSLLEATAVFHPELGEKITVVPGYKHKVKRVVEATLNSLNMPFLGGRITIESNIPEAKGYGSSTADCIAAVVAVANAVGRRIEHEELARLVVEAEIASDSFMFNQAVLFAHREGRVLEDYGKRMPAFDVLGLDTEASGIVDTLDFPPARYSRNQIQTFQMLIGALRYGIRHQNLHLLGRVATACADLNQEFLPKRMYAEIRAFAMSAGALGIVTAHSGTVLAILLDPKDPALQKKVNTIKSELQLLGITNVMRFHN